MLKRLARLLSNVEPQQDTFKLYIRSAEAIDKQAKQRAQILKNIRESLKTPQQTDEVTAFIRSHHLLDKLFACRSQQKLQLTLEEAYLSASKSYKNSEDTKKPELTPGSLTERLMVVWDERPQIRLLDAPLMGLLRNIWLNSVTQPQSHLGTFQRITKDKEDPYSPFFYGEMGDAVYLSLVKGMGKSPSGIQIIRRVVDHMHAFSHTPSPELSEALITECIQGRWPRALRTVLKYSVDKSISIPVKGWADSIQFFRYTSGYFETAVEAVRQAIENGCEARWELIKPIVHKYVQHDMSKEASELVQEHIKTAVKTVKAAGGTLKEAQGEAVAQMYMEYCKLLLESDRELEARETYEAYLADATQKVEASYEIGFSLYEKTANPAGGRELYNKIKTSKTIALTPRLVVAALKMAVKLKTQSADLVLDLEEQMWNRSDLYTPFAFNLLVVFYGNSKDWEKLLLLLGRAAQGLKLNKHSRPTIEKYIEGCLVPTFKKKMVELAQGLKFQG